MATTSNTGEMRVVLPDDVVFRILLWLPVASLLRFKSVCKSWLSLIESSCFIIQHYHHLHLPNNNLLYQEEEEENILVVTHPLFYEQDPCFSVSVSLLSGNKFQVLQNFHLPHSSIEEGVHRVQILASCDGIICIQHDNYRDVSLLNPGTKQCRILPRSLPVPPDFEISQGECQGTNINGGFGLDVKYNYYKLVRILEVVRGRKIPKVIERQVEVYSLNTNSWTTIDDVVLPTGIFILGSDLNAPFQNGIHCWLGRIPSSCEYGMVRTWFTSLVSFDFSNCVFETMPLPDVYTVGNFNLRLALFRKNVACIEQPDCGYVEECDCNVWVMNEYGVKESWYKLYTVKLDQYNYPIGFSKKRRDYLQERRLWGREAELCLCDPVTKELQSLPIQPLEPYFKIAVYKESLVSIKSLNGETNIVHFNSVV